MATWIFILHMLVPLSSGLQAAQAATLSADVPAATPDDVDGLRYRGLERMFAKFDEEA